MKILHVVQIDMAEEGRASDWCNVRAFDTQEAAVRDIERMKKEYGDTIPFQVVMVEYHSE